MTETERLARQAAEIAQCSQAYVAIWRWAPELVREYERLRKEQEDTQ